MITEKKKQQIKKSIRKKRGQDDSDDSGPEEKIPMDQMDYNAPKPGPHAKVTRFKWLPTSNGIFNSLILWL